MLGWQGKIKQEVCRRCLHSAAIAGSKPKQPFFRESAHRLPTLWQTYRSIIAQTVQILQSGDGVKTLGRHDPVLDDVRNRWRKARSWTSVQNSRAFLENEQNVSHLASMYALNPPAHSNMDRSERRGPQRARRSSRRDPQDSCETKTD
jgi:hypothetical protein